MSYLELYRYDAAIISFLSYMVGAKIAGDLTVQDVGIALAVSLVSFNFIYSFNSWSDWKIDRVNKPHRPIPSGKIKPRQALAYSLVLLALSLLYPIWVFEDALTLALFLMLPVLGTIYSMRPFRLKAYAVTATPVTSAILVIPITLGYFMNSSDPGIIPFFVLLFVYCLSTIPLKDIEDVEGDAGDGCQNAYMVLGRKGLFAYAIAMLVVNLLLTLVFALPTELKIYLYVFIVSTMFTIGFFALAGRNLKTLYGAIIRVVMVEGLALFVVLSLI